MIRKAIERGVPEEKIAKALDIDLQQRFGGRSDCWTGSARKPWRS